MGRCVGPSSHRLAGGTEALGFGMGEVAGEHLAVGPDPHYTRALVSVERLGRDPNWFAAAPIDPIKAFPP